MKSADRFGKAAIVVCLMPGAACGSDGSGAPAPSPQTPVPVVTSTSLAGANTSIPSVGQTLQLKVIETLSDGSTKDITTCCSFESSDASVASANQTGLVTAWAPGVTTMTAVQLQAGQQNPLGSGSVSVTSGPPVDPNRIPALLSPDDGAVVPATAAGILTFNWSPVPAATAYHVNVQRTGSQFPVLDKADILNPPWQIITGDIAPANFTGWHWSVQAMVGGLYQPWSSVRMFSYAAGSREASARLAGQWWLHAPVSPGIAARPSRAR